jgi:tetratricopeptide (TPR) repeat protein
MRSKKILKSKEKKLKTMKFVIFYCLLFIIYSFSALASPALAVDEKLRTADEYLKAENYIMAKRLYREIFLSEIKGPAAERALLGRGKADYYLRNYYEANQLIKRLISNYPDSEYLNESYLYLGYISLRLNRLANAVQYFRKVEGDLRQRALIRMAEAALINNEIEQAESLLKGVDPGLLNVDPHSLYVRSMIYSKRGMHRQAAETINRIVEEDLKEMEIRVNKARIFFDAGNFKESENISVNIINNPVSRRERLGAKRILLSIYEKEERINDALKLSLALFPYETGDDFRLKIASLYDKKNDIDGAMRFLALLRDRGLRSSEMEKRLGKIIASGKPEAMDYILKYSVFLSPDKPFIVEVAKYLVSGAKKREGMQLLSKALRGNVRGEASLYLSELMIAGGRFDDAKGLLSIAILDTRYMFKASYLLAEIMEKEGNLSGAIRHLERIVGLARDYKIPARLGNLYFKAGDRRKSLRYYIMASDRGDAISSIIAADFFYMEGRYRSAKQYYKKAINRGIKEPGQLQWAYYQYGKLTGSREHLKKAAAKGGEIAEAARIIIME